MQSVDVIFTIIVLIMSVVVHEVSHGYIANFLGDPTARLQGRLTLNPINHIDPIGSILVPLASYFLGGFVIGWAKPVPFNPYNLRAGKWGPAIVALAGPASNLLLAVIFSVLLRLGLSSSFITAPAANIFSIIITINLILAIFNLIPVPPLDGSKLLFAVLPYQWKAVQDFMERYQLVLIFVLIFFGWRLFLPLVGSLLRLLLLY